MLRRSMPMETQSRRRRWTEAGGEGGTAAEAVFVGQWGEAEHAEWQASRWARVDAPGLG
ncbi:MAG TPA: hypothetical protein VMM77_00480 [Gemmatimonadaceae bacterium]|nr:hypothetical protein [Gemmatimonadaceae bacterium]